MNQTDKPRTTATEAANEYIARRDRKTHPSGRSDNGGRWYPSDTERCQCCADIRGPSRAYPWAYMTHCRTRQHVATLYGVTLADLNKALREIEPPKPRASMAGVYYKAVALLDNGSYASIYNGSVYEIGQTYIDAARQNHNGGYYVYRSRAEARNAAVPSNSALRDSLRAILEVHCEGRHCRYSNKYSFSRMTIIRRLEGTINPFVIAQLR